MRATRFLLGLGIAALVPGNPAIAVDCTLKSGVTAAQGREGLCGFSAANRSFRGTPAQQAECLTRAVGRGAAIGAPTLTPFLRERVGQPTNVTRARLAAYLAELHVDPGRLGGPLADPVSARYFIIHDTSTPNCSAADFSTQLCPARGIMPPNRDTAEWAAIAKFFGHPKPFPNRLAHAFTNRVGDSITEVPFDAHISTTKFEGCSDSAAKQRLFIGIENIQPRIGAPAVPAPGKKANDLVAPVPGFTTAQYRRLALLYVTASVREGRWLIPAFHAVLDSRYADGHDDPQNFDVPAFSDAVRAHLDKLAS
ncbi:MAG TPA: hypothetical protein VF547_10035 [Allosphingosinicella sp.]|jgi:hypothetical protein